MPNSTVCLTFDFDALSVWLAYDRVTPAMRWRGEYGARVGVPRILDLLRRHELRATFFVPGHTVESFPDETESILAADHELAHHSYAHVDPSGQAPDEERADMEHSKIAQDADDPADVAKEAFEALMAGKQQVVAGSVMNTVMARAGRFVPDALKAKAHGKLAEPVDED